MKDKKYSAVLFGATYFAVGYALSHENCLIVDKGINIGTEFFGEFSADIQPDSDNDFAKANELISLAKQYAATDYFTMQGVLAKMLCNSGADVLLETNAFGSFAKKDSDIITLCDKNGMFDVHTDKVIDTTSLGSLNYLANDSLRNQMCKSENYITKYVCASTDCGFIKMAVPIALSFDVAASALADAVPENEHIAAFYDRFTYDFAGPYNMSGYGYSHIPSAQFDSGISAFCSGIKTDCGENGAEKSGGVQ